MILLLGPQFKNCVKKKEKKLFLSAVTHSGHLKLQQNQHCCIVTDLLNCLSLLRYKLLYL